MKMLVCWFAVVAILVCHAFSYAGILGNIDNMNKIYSEESHCLLAPELRGKEDNPISCYCRDSILDARYVYGNYVLTGKDRNLNGAYLTLEDHARQMCGEQYDVLKALQAENWRWDGPQVTREYPPEKELLKIQPDSKGFRTVEYKVHLLYLDKGGRVKKVENRSAVDRLPTNLKK
jgi:hypothetical protein